MLTFFRKHQKIFFLIVTIFVVSSFAFFGTYQTFSPTKVKDEVLFETDDGKKICQSYFQDFVKFLALEPLSVRSYGNILNDQIITKDFIETGLFSLVIKQSKEKICDELNTKHQKEKSFRPYKHSISHEISAENVWATFAPNLKELLLYFTKCKEGDSDEAIALRQHLFLMERKFPGELLSYILRYQEKDMANLEKDPRLQAENLSLFGYKTITDWFGTAFVENAAQVILKAASFARAQGYSVSKEEILAELAYRREKAYSYYNNQWDNSYSFYQDCLKFLQMDELKVMAIMEDVLLFRHLFTDIAHVNLVDTFSLQRFYGKAHECIEAEITHLPSELYFKNEQELKKFEAYLRAVSTNRGELLDLPEEINSIEKVKEVCPELVATKFTLELGSVSKKELEAKVTVKATWDWEEKHESEFAELKDYASLDVDKRALVDTFARKKIVENHPEWTQFALNEKEKVEKVLVISEASKNFPLAGITDIPSFVAELEKGDVALYSQDNENFYSFKVKQKSEVLLSYQEALESRILDGIAKGYDESEFKKVLSAVFEDAKERGLIKKEANFDEVRESLPKFRFAHFLASKNHHNIWKLEKRKEKIFRHGEALISFDEAASFKEKLFFSNNVGPFYYKEMDRRVENPMPVDKMFMEEKFVSDEIKILLMEKIIGNTPS